MWVFSVVFHFTFWEWTLSTNMLCEENARFVTAIALTQNGNSYSTNFGGIMDKRNIFLKEWNENFIYSSLHVYIYILG